MKTIIVLAVIGLAGMLLYNFFSRKQTALYVVLVNFNLIQESSEGLSTPFAEENIDTRKEEIIIDSSSYISSDANEADFIKYGYEDEQRLFAMIMAGDMDLFISGKDVLERYAEQSWFDDLRTVIDEKELNRLDEDSILYWQDTAIGIRINDSSILNEYYYYNGRKGEPVYAGFPAGSRHKVLAVKFLRYLLTE